METSPHFPPAICFLLHPQLSFNAANVHLVVHTPLHMHLLGAHSFLFFFPRIFATSTACSSLSGAFSGVVLLASFSPFSLGTQRSTYTHTRAGLSRPVCLFKRNRLRIPQGRERQMSFCLPANATLSFFPCHFSHHRSQFLARFHFLLR